MFELICFNPRCNDQILGCQLAQHMRQISAAEFSLIKQRTQTQLLPSNCLLFTCPPNQLSFMRTSPIITNVCLSFALPPASPPNGHYSINSPWGKFKKETQLRLTGVTFCSANGFMCVSAHDRCGTKSQRVYFSHTKQQHYTWHHIGRQKPKR